MPFAGLRHVPPGGLLVMAGSPATTVYLVRRGQVRVFLLAECGRATTTAVLGPGQLVGIAPLVGRPTYHAFVQALTPVEVWSLPVDRVLERLPHDTALLGLVGAAVGRRLSLAQHLLADVALLPVGERVRDALERLGPCLGGEQPHLTRTALAQLVGARRESVSRALGWPRA